MSTIHDQIDELLAADLHGELSAAERDAFHRHLVECADCRQAFQEEKNMHKILNETLADKRADTGFEQRMVSRFRDRVPQRPGLVQLVTNLVRLRAVQLTAAAALLLSMVQVGRMITGESTTPLARRKDTASLPQSELTKSAPSANRDIGALAANIDARSVDQFAASNSSSGAGIMAQNPASPPAHLQIGQKVIADPVQRQGDQLGFNQGVSEQQGRLLQDKEATSLEGMGQLPSLVGNTRTKKSDAAKDEQKGNEEFVEKSESAPPSSSPVANRKLVRNATAELEVVSFEEAVQKITGFAAEDKGYVATSSSQKQANGKLRGEIVIKVLPDNLDRFLLKLRGLGELKNQALTTDDVTKQYFDTESRMKNSQLMEQRLIEILKTKSKDVSDLLEVEKELGRVREQIETMQGELKLMDSQVQFATVAVQVSEKNMNVPVAFLLKERAQLALYAAEVEKTYNEIKALASPKVQITNAQVNRDNTGRVSAYLYMLITPEESESIISRVKGMARVENFQVQTERVAQGGDGLGENAKTERDKVVLNVTISREEQEQSLQQTSLRIRSAEVNDRTKQLRDLAEKQNGRIRSSSFSRDTNGREFANVSLRVPMKNYSALMQSLNTLGKVENVSVQRVDRPDAQASEADAPADISIQVYSQGNLVSEETGIMATLRRTVGQGAMALMWSARMIGVALAFLAPWILALVGAGWVMRRVARARRLRKKLAEERNGLS